MGRFAALSQFIRKSGRTDVRCNPGGGATVDAYHMQGAGDDSHPLPTDTAILVEVPRSRNFAAVGYNDPSNAQTAQVGERRLYARNADGAQVAEVFLRNTGQVRMSNDNGFVDLAPDGTITLDDGSGGTIAISGGVITLTGTAINLVGATNINGLVVTGSGQMTDASGISLHGHSHTQDPDSAGNTQARTDEASQP
ncbi:hypothetical protein NVP1009O_17 [Vibrio phage 1.009.O._10N.261.51.C9]|nr:hypothetical protein NVP1009O_17 [Vibrio phage 1.009.O._10N.261.51.C9]